MMKQNEAVRKLSNFCSRDFDKVKKPAVKGGKVYATNGVIGLRVDARCQKDDCPPTYPLDTLDSQISFQQSDVKWYRMNWDRIKALRKLFEDRVKEERQSLVMEGEERYIECSCPCCSKTILWDRIEKGLVKGKPVREATPQDVLMAVELRCGEEKIIVNFAYLYLLHTFLEDYMNTVVYTIGRDILGEKVLRFKYLNGKLSGVLAKMRDTGDNKDIGYHLILDAIE